MDTRKLRIWRGANSVMNNAVPSDSGSATTIATVAIRMVPTITAAIPNLPASGSQACSVKKFHPALFRACEARKARNDPTKTMMMSTTEPPARMTPRKTLSLPSRMMVSLRGVSVCMNPFPKGVGCDFCRYPIVD